MNPHPQIGTWLSIGSPVITELAGLCGFDWVLIDLEHGSSPEAAVPDQLRALRGSQTLGIVRVGHPHPDQIARILDWGAHGIMVPRVDSADEARAAVRAAHHLPLGARGYSRTVRAFDYGLRSPEALPPPLVIAQIETGEGVAEAAGIAAVEGVGVLFVGPADLRRDLDCRPPQESRDFEACLDLVVRAARAAGKPAGILIRDLEELPRRRRQGFTFIAVQSDLVLLQTAFRALIACRHQDVKSDQEEEGKAR